MPHLFLHYWQGYTAVKRIVHDVDVAYVPLILEVLQLPNLSVSQLENTLILAAVDLGNPGPDDDYGYGLIDVAEAYELAGSMCLADFDGDYDVDSSDLAVLAVEWLRTDCTGETVCQSDLGSDGEVNFHDYAEFAGQYGQTICSH